LTSFFGQLSTVQITMQSDFQLEKKNVKSIFRKCNEINQNITANEMHQSSNSLDC